jgi:hypothetical protein
MNILLFGAMGMVGDGVLRSRQQQRSLALAQLKEEFFQLAADTERNRAGLALEKLLNRLF